MGGEMRGMAERKIGPEELVIVRDPQTGRPTTKRAGDVNQKYLAEAKQGLTDGPPAETAKQTNHAAGSDGDIL